MSSSSSSGADGSLVHEGLWVHHSGLAGQNWSWTLRDSRALLVLASLSILIAITQSRIWVLARYFILLWNKPVRLDDDENPELLRKISQGHAMAEMLLPTLINVRWLQKLLRKHRTTGGTIYVVSPWFGIIAVTNFVLFVVLTVSVPWILSYWSVESPIVQSRLTDSCLEAEFFNRFMPFLTQYPKSEIAYQQCAEQPQGRCKENYFLTQQDIRSSRVDTCPFPGNICWNGTKPIELVHRNIRPNEFGVNSRSKATMNHRITCAPMYLDSLQMFQWEILNKTIKPTSYITVRDPHNAQFRSWDNSSMELRTWNSPNFLSSNSSGLEMAKRGYSHDMNVLPRFFEGREGLYHTHPETQHPDIRRDDAMSFLAIYRAGARAYWTKLDDPFFAAHNDMSFDNSPMFYADREATAIGCAEQFQFCTPGEAYCSPWAKTTAQLRNVFFHPSVANDVPSLAEFLVFFRVLPSEVSVYSFLAGAIEWHSAVPLTHSNPWIGMVSQSFNNSVEQWVIEVESWLAKAAFNGLLNVRNGMKTSSNGIEEITDVDFKKKFALCGRILFRSDEHTNIDFTGLCVTIAVAVFVCALSSCIEWLHSCLKSMPRLVSNTLIAAAAATGWIKGTRWRAGAGQNPLWLQMFTRYVPRLWKSGRRDGPTSSRPSDSQPFELEGY